MALTQLTGGKFMDMAGNPLSNGYLEFSLSHDERDSSNNAQIVGGLKRKIFLDNNGSAVTGSAIEATDALTPPGSYYVVDARTSDGRQAFKCSQNWQILSSPDPFDLGNLTPINPPGIGFGSEGEITLQTNGINNSDQNLLNLSAGSGITLANSAGTTTISAASIPTTSPAYFGNWEGTPLTLSSPASGNFNSTSANLVSVVMFRLPFAQPFNTLTFRTSAVSSSTVGIGVYSSSRSRLIHWDSIAVAFNNVTQTATPTGGSVLLQPGYYYWAWACSITGTVSTAGGLINSTSGEGSKPWNNSFIRTGVAANAMSAGVLPSTLGTLTGGFNNSSQECPVWIVEP